MVDRRWVATSRYGGRRSPHAVAVSLADHRVITSYLGTNEDVVHRSGSRPSPAYGAPEPGLRW